MNWEEEDWRKQLKSHHSSFVFVLWKEFGLRSSLNECLRVHVLVYIYHVRRRCAFVLEFTAHVRANPFAFLFYRLLNICYGAPIHRTVGTIVVLANVLNNSSFINLAELYPTFFNSCARYFELNFSSKGIWIILI